ncbi:hypothetical protein [Pseudochryseolinea flava]|uniref:Uncharacterized protein n=1 Tax=Pseudochryseolinea flava TaxID=2059302 RepID=A0A364XXC1_9BACT|nr:hypothetical protein [Pseudochryseolinea flava]RAV98887.1 hypothetical protein DQQ10_21535 [Pseudochryseolinea flava]
MINYIFLFCFILCPFLVAGQSSLADQHLIWHSNRSNELHSNVEVAATCRFETHANNPIQLVYSSETFSFEIVSVEGTWNNINEDGFLTYVVNYQNHQGHIKFERINNVIAVVVDFTQAAATAMHQRYIISETE